MSSNYLGTGYPCPECGSSDAVAEYHNGLHCHKCQEKYPSKQKYEELTGVTCKFPQTQEGDIVIDNKPVTQGNFQVPEGYELIQAKHRGIKPETLKKYGIRFSPKGDMLSLIRDRKGTVSGAQSCKAERVDGKKQIVALGDTMSGGLFGQHLFSGDKRRIVITEGFLDCCSAYDMLNERYAVVSVINGVGSALKDVKRNIDYLETFEEVIFCFDNDKPGHDKAKECAAELTPGKAKIVPLAGRNDCNDFLQAGDIQSFTKAFWDAKRFHPDGIVNLADIFDQVLEEDEKPSIPYPWEGLNDMLDGIRTSELVTITSGSGMGFD